MNITLVVLTALLMDAWLGEPRRFHPLVGFGKLAELTERTIYADARMHGSMAVLLLVAPLILLTTCIDFISWHVVIDVLVLYLAIGWNSLGMHASRVKHALLADNLAAARYQVSLMVSRDTAELDRAGITQGTIESVLENGNDAIFGAIFWFVVAGAPGAIAYRLVNTLDAMWGYRNERYRHFGWAAARLDDCLNFIPARLTALSYALTGKVRHALICWRTQGTIWKSPNAGPVMAAGAGSLSLSLGGPACYHGKLEFRPFLGTGQEPEIGDIDRALALIKRALISGCLLSAQENGFLDAWQQLNHHGPLHHGGRLRAAATHFAIPLENWLDLSTGINANGWPVRTPPASSWTRLPEEEDELNATASRYYGMNFLLPVAGSQAAIQSLPQLRAPSRVSVLNPGYAEHADAWKRNHHTVSAVSPEQIDAILPDTDVLIIIHPNNPTGATFPISQLLNWHAQLVQRGGWLIVDEAFIDATPELSIASLYDEAWSDCIALFR